jgi:hypothetical protein
MWGQPPSAVHSSAARNSHGDHNHNRLSFRRSRAPVPPRPANEELALRLPKGPVQLASATASRFITRLIHTRFPRPRLPHSSRFSTSGNHGPQSSVSRRHHKRLERPTNIPVASTDAFFRVSTNRDCHPEATESSAPPRTPEEGPMQLADGAASRFTTRADSYVLPQNRGCPNSSRFSTRGNYGPSPSMYSVVFIRHSLLLWPNLVAYHLVTGLLLLPLCPE